MLPVSRLSPLALAATLAGLFSACQSNEGVTESGLRYVIHKDAEGEPAKVGDVVSFHYEVRNSRDSLLADTRQMGRPMQSELQPPAFKGGLEDGLMMMSVGDSATFYVSADSLMSVMGMPRPAFIDSNSTLAYTVVMMEVKTVHRGALVPRQHNHHR